MSQALAAPRTGFKFMVTVREGPDAGASFQLLPPRVTIGRGADNNISLNDPRMSRSAAVIEFSMERIVISDVSGRQAMAVNGDFCVEASIKNGDVISIGDTHFAFIVEAVAVVRTPSGPMALDGQVPPPGFPPPGAPRPMAASNAGASGKQKFYIGVAIGLVAFAFLMNSETTKKKKETQIRTIEEIEKEIKESEDRQAEVMKKRVFKNDDEKTRFEEAQRHFIEGFRDFQKGQWVRAMRSFETAKTIDPQHALATRYYRLAEKARDEVIALLTLEGRRYREKSMYARCSAQFEKVLDLIPNKNDVKYQAAEALKKECDLQLEGRFRYK